MGNFKKSSAAPSGPLHVSTPFGDYDLDDNKIVQVDDGPASYDLEVHPFFERTEAKADFVVETPVAGDDPQPEPDAPAPEPVVVKVDPAPDTLFSPDTVKAATR